MSETEHLITKVALEGVETVKQQQRTIGAGYREIGSESAAASATSRRANTAAAGSVRQMRTEVETAARAAKQARQEMMEGVRDLSTASGLLGVGIAGALGAGAMRARDYRKQLMSIQTMTGANVREMQRYEALIGGQSPLFSENDIARAIKAGKVANLTGEEISKLMPHLRNAAAAMGESIETAMSGVGRAASFGEAELAERVGLQLREFAVTKESMALYGKKLSQLDEEQKKRVVLAAAMRQLQKFQDGEAKALQSGAYGLEQFTTAVGSLGREIADPAFMTASKTLGKAADGVRWVNEHMSDGMKTAVGWGGAILVGTLLAVGAAGRAAFAVNQLAQAWARVTKNSAAATATQLAAGAAGQAAGAASGPIPSGAPSKGTPYYGTGPNPSMPPPKGGAGAGVPYGSAAGGAAVSRLGRAKRWFGGVTRSGLRRVPAGIRGGIGRGIGAGRGLLGRGVTAGARILPGAGKVAAGTGGVITAAMVASEVLDWLGGTVAGQGGKRLGNGGWMPNFSPMRAGSEGWGAVQDYRGAGRNRAAAEEGARIAQDYIRNRGGSIRAKDEAMMAKVMPSAGGDAKAGTSKLMETNNKLLGKLVEISGKRAMVGGDSRMARALNEGALQRAVFRGLARNIV